MQSKTANDKKPQGKRSAYEPTPEDVVGMLEAGLEELSRHFTFTAENVAGGVVLTIQGVKKMDDGKGWWLTPATAGEGKVEDDK